MHLEFKPHDTSRKGRLEILNEIYQDCEADVQKIDGMPATGLNIGTVLGEMYAMIQALANVLRSEIEEREGE